MVPNAFIGKPKQPTDKELTAALGRARAGWDRLLDALATKCGVETCEWHSYSRKAGWSVRMKVKDRNILYLGPCQGSFRVAFILGDKAVAAAGQNKWVNAGKKYPEGTAVRIEPVGVKDIPAIVALAALKLAH
jgi:hypothetical protein